jgi:hypothetical protein
MTEALRGMVALELLRLMVTSAQPRACVDVTSARIVRPVPVAEAPRARPVAAPMTATEIADVEREEAEQIAQPLVAVAVAGRRRGPARRFTDAELLVAVEMGLTTAQIAAKLGAEVTSINLHRRRLGVPAPRTGWKAAAAARKAKSAAGCAPQVTWDAANVARLRDLVMQSPRPTNESMAASFGTTVNAIQTAMSRAGITMFDAPRSGRQLADLSGFTKRNCMTCEQPFTSEGKHNRRCNSCKSNDSCAVAA